MGRITVSYFRKVYKQFTDEEITMSRMVELLNEKADEDELHQPTVISAVCDNHEWKISRDGEVKYCTKCDEREWNV